MSFHPSATRDTTKHFVLLGTQYKESPRVLIVDTLPNYWTLEMLNQKVRQNLPVKGVIPWRLNETNNRGHVDPETINRYKQLVGCRGQGQRRAHGYKDACAISANWPYRDEKGFVLVTDNGSKIRFPEISQDFKSASLRDIS